MVQVRPCLQGSTLRVHRPRFEFGRGKSSAEAYDLCRPCRPGTCCSRRSEAGGTTGHSTGNATCCGGLMFQYCCTPITPASSHHSRHDPVAPYHKGRPAGSRKQPYISNVWTKHSRCIHMHSLKWTPSTTSVSVAAQTHQGTQSVQENTPAPFCCLPLPPFAPALLRCSTA